MVVQEGSGERVDENLELGAVRNLAGEAGIEGVNAFYKQNAAVSQLELLAVVFPQTGYEIEFRYRHLFSGDELHDVALHEGMVHRFEIIEIVGAVGEFGRFYAVHEIVVRAHGHGVQAAGLQLDGKTLAEGGFTGRGRAGDKNYLQGSFTVVAAVYFLGNLHYLLFLQGFCYLDELAGAAAQEGFIYVSHRVQAHDDVPAEGFLEHLESLGLVHKGGYAAGVFAGWHLQEHTVMVGDKSPYLQIAGGGHQFSVVIIGRISQRIIICVGFSAGFQEAHLILKACLLEFLDGPFRLHVVAVEGEVLLYQLFHAAFYQGNVLRSDFGVIGLSDMAEIPVGNGVLYVQLTSRQNVTGGLVQQEIQGTAVHAHAAGLPGVYELNVFVLVYLELEPLRHIVHLGRYNGVGTLEFELVEHLHQRCPFRETLGFLGVLAIDLDHNILLSIMWCYKISRLRSK